MPSSASSSLSGICIFLAAYEINSFTSKDYIPEEWHPLTLSNGRIIDKGEEALKQIIFDVNDENIFYNGYIRGFIYLKGKFLGKMYYVSTTNRPPESLDGTYSFIEGGVEL